MVRHPVKKADPAPEATVPEAPAPEEKGAVREVLIDLDLLNDKLNYIITTVNKIAVACEIDLTK